MGFFDISPGTKLAKVVSARFTTSKSGSNGLEVTFSFEEPSSGNRETIRWTAWLTPKAMERSMDTLVNVLGYNGSEEMDLEGNLTDFAAFDFTREVNIVVEDEEYNGKISPKVKWVNPVGGGKFSNASPEIIKASLNNAGFKAAFLAAKQQQKPKTELGF